MTNLIGEFECTLDVKGRILMPGLLKKQIPASAKNRFVINRGFEGCLVIYPRNEWLIESAVVNKLNMYKRENREFLRAFMNGATELTLDGNNRLLLPKNLLSTAGITKDIVLFAFSNRIEVWSKKAYQKMIKTEPAAFAALAEKVMGSNSSENKT